VEVPVNVVDHRPPLRRIDFNPVRKRPETVADAGFSFSPAEVDRIWRITRQVAEGTNATITVANGDPVEWWDPE
jgi:hypothetical protein